MYRVFYAGNSYEFNDFDEVLHYVDLKMVEFRCTGLHQKTDGTKTTIKIFTEDKDLEFTIYEIR